MSIFLEHDLNRFHKRWMSARIRSSSHLSKRERVILRVRCELGEAGRYVEQELVEHSLLYGDDKHDALLDAVTDWLDERAARFASFEQGQPEWFKETLRPSLNERFVEAIGKGNSRW